METLHLESVVTALLLIAMRVSGLMLGAPFLSSEGIPAAVKAGFVLALTALLYPVCRLPRWESSTLGWMGLAGGEIAIGLLLGLAAQLTIEAAQMAGHLFGLQAGYSLVTLLDPQTQADMPVLATFNQLVALLIFLRLDVHHWLLRALAASFSYLPPGAGISNWRSGAGLLQAAGGMWLLGLEIAAPVVAATLLVDVTLGFLAKASPQMPILFLGLPLKTLLSLAVIAGTLALWPGIFERHFAGGISLGERLLHLAR